MKIYNLLRELVVKELKTRYGRPMLGFMWAFIVPSSMVLVFYAVFSLIFKVNVTESPYLLYLITGVFPWRFFQDSVGSAVTSLVDNRSILKETRLPYYAVPFAVVLVSLINFIPALLVIIVIAAVMMGGLSQMIMALPAVLAVHVLMAASVSVLVSVIYASWRDIKYVVDIFLMVVFYLSPVFYSVSMVRDLIPPDLVLQYAANPFVSIMQGYRIVLIKGFGPAVAVGDWIALALIESAVFLALMAAAALLVYRSGRNRLIERLSY